MAKLDIFRFFALVRAILPRALMVGSDTAAIGGPPGEHPRAMSFLYLGVRHSGRPPREWQPHLHRCSAQWEQIDLFSVVGVEDVRSGLDLTGLSLSKYDLEREICRLRQFTPCIQSRRPRGDTGGHTRKFSQPTGVLRDRSCRNPTSPLRTLSRWSPRW